MSAATSPTVFNSGVPTEPDVKKLFESFGEPAVGAKVTYDEISKAIREEVGSNRFRSVVEAWRKTLYRNHNIVLRAVPGVGFEVMDPTSRILYCGARVKSHLRGVNRVSNVAERTDAANLTPELSKVRDHLVRVSTAIRLTAATEAKKLKYPA
jgi:hypothetical protein